MKYLKSTFLPGTSIQCLKSLFGLIWIGEGDLSCLRESLQFKENSESERGNKDLRTA